MRIKLGLIELILLIFFYFYLFSKRNRMPKLKKKHIEIGTDSRNDYTGWNYDSNTNFS